MSLSITDDRCNFTCLGQTENRAATYSLKKVSFARSCKVALASLVRNTSCLFSKMAEIRFLYPGSCSVRRLDIFPSYQRESGR